MAVKNAMNVNNRRIKVSNVCVQPQRNSNINNYRHDTQNNDCLGLHSSKQTINVETSKMCIHSWFSCRL